MVFSHRFLNCVETMFIHYLKRESGADGLVACDLVSEAGGGTQTLRELHTVAARVPGQKAHT